MTSQELMLKNKFMVEYADALTDDYVEFRECEKFIEWADENDIKVTRNMVNWAVSNGLYLAYLDESDLLWAYQDAVDADGWGGCCKEYIKAHKCKGMVC